MKPHLKTDVWGTVEKLQKQDISVYDMILAAAVKARDISKRRNFLDTKDGRLNKYSMKPINQALKEIEDEVNNIESE
jgi:DNA-directed RNA polymerase subunit K/omega